MGYSIGDLLAFRQDALTQSIKTVSSVQDRVGLKRLFKTIKQNSGTDIIKWRIWKETRKLAKFNVRNNPAKRVPGTGGRQLTEALTQIFISLPIDEDVLIMAESPDDNPKQRALDWIMAAQEELVSLGDNSLEWAIWELLTTGEISIDQTGDPRAPFIRTLTFGVDPLHVAQNTTLDYSDPDVLILSDTTSGEAWGDLLAIPEEDGYLVDEVFMNRITNRYLFGNAEVQKLWSDRRRDILIEKAQITRLDTANVSTYNRMYEDDEGDLQKFLPTDYIVGVPSEEVRAKLFTLQEGECMVPDEQSKKLKLAMGKQSWVEFTSNPAAAEIFYKWNALPVVLDPDSWFSRNVVPAA